VRRGLAARAGSARRRRSRAAIEWDPDGDGPQASWVVFGGLFDVAGEVVAHGVVLWDPLTRRFAPLGDCPVGQVLTLVALRDGSLVAAGHDSDAYGQPAAMIARWDGRAWSSLATTPSTSSSIYHLLPLDDGGILACGSFSTINGVSARSIAKWDGLQWRPLAAGIQGLVSDALQMPDGSVVAGGSFTSVGGVAMWHVARWDGSAWRAMPGLGGIPAMGVSALSFAANGDIIAGGRFTVGATGEHAMARWNGSQWAPWPQPSPQYVNSIIALNNENFVVSGVLSSNLNGISRWNGSNWVEQATVHPSSSATVGAMLRLEDGRLVIGGAMAQVNTVPAMNVAIFDWTTWSPLARGFNGSINSLLAIHGNSPLIAAGRFTQSPDGHASAAARWNGDSWSPMPGIAGYGNGYFPTAYSLAQLPGGDIVASGVWYEPWSAIIRWNGAEWQPLTPYSEPSPALSMHVAEDGSMILAGAFDYATDSDPYPVATWNGGALRRLGPGLAGALLDQRANAVIVQPESGSIIVGGDFIDCTGCGSPNIDRVARWTGEDWEQVGTGLQGGGFAVNALANLPDGRIVAGGDFTTAGSTPTLGVAIWDGVRWSPLGEGIPGEVRSLVVLPNGDLIAGGSFRIAGGVSANSIARWDGLAWHPLGNGVDNGVNALAVLPDGTLAVGGTFLCAGGRVSAFFARYSFDIPCCDPDLNHDGNVDQDDLAYLVAVVAGGPNPTGIDPDFNRDGNVDQDDVAALVNVVAGGPCP
jgi:trimeric autotransporter adhesin